MNYIKTFESFLNESKNTWDLWDNFLVMYRVSADGAVIKKRQEYADKELNDPTNVLHKYIPNWSSLDHNGTFDALKKLRGTADKEVYDYIMKVRGEMLKIR